MGGSVSILTKPQKNQAAVNKEEVIAYLEPAPEQLNLTKLLESPRCKERESNMLECIPNTPNGPQVNIYRYYCPLCMEYFKDILRSNCCGNYTCYPCCTTFIQSRGIDVCSLHQICNDESVQSLPCPHCSSLGFQPNTVELDSDARQYTTEIAVSEKQQQLVQNACSGCFSPLKIGDSFESMKRKMIPIQSFRGFSDKETVMSERTLTPTEHKMEYIGIARENSYTADPYLRHAKLTVAQILLQVSESVTTKNFNYNVMCQ